MASLARTLPSATTAAPLRAEVVEPFRQEALRRPFASISIAGAVRLALSLSTAAASKNPPQHGRVELRLKAHRAERAAIASKAAGAQWRCGSYAGRGNRLGEEKRGVGHGTAPILRRRLRIPTASIRIIISVNRSSIAPAVEHALDRSDEGPSAGANIDVIVRLVQLRGSR
jgi:hypothetical protein